MNKIIINTCWVLGWIFLAYTMYYLCFKFKPRVCQDCWDIEGGKTALMFVVSFGLLILGSFKIEKQIKQ